jgi:hypothetical protein
MQHRFFHPDKIKLEITHEPEEVTRKLRKYGAFNENKNTVYGKLQNLANAVSGKKLTE